MLDNGENGQTRNGVLLWIVLALVIACLVLVSLAFAGGPRSPDEVIRDFGTELRGLHQQQRMVDDKLKRLEQHTQQRTPTPAEGD